MSVLKGKNPLSYRSLIRLYLKEGIVEAFVEDAREKFGLGEDKVMHRLDPIVKTAVKDSPICMKFAD